MVTEQEIIDNMTKTFPKCPTCNYRESYRAEIGPLIYVQCEQCGAKFRSPQFRSGETLVKMQLYELPKTGRYKDIKYQVRSVDFWRKLTKNNNSKRSPRARRQSVDNIFAERKAKGEIVFDDDWSDQDIMLEIKRYG